jgi:hypothetical protein
MTTPEENEIKNVSPISVSGDIILFYADSFSLNTFAQSVFRRRIAEHSHVAIAIKWGNVLHAMPKVGVESEGIRELLLKKGNFVVYRNKRFQNDVNLLEELEDAILYYQGQHYNLIFFKHRWHASYCSELVAKAYDKVGVRISNRAPKNTLPSDIFHYVKSSDDWMNITDDYNNFFLSDDYPEVLDMASNMIRILENQNQDMAFNQMLLFKKIQRVAPDNEYYKSLKPTRDYWSNDPSKISKLTFIFFYLSQLIRRIWNKLKP